MNAWMRLLTFGQTAASSGAGAKPQAAVGDELVTYRLGRLEQFDDPRWLWLGVAVTAVLLVVFVAWQYRRESVALPRWATLLLGALRLVAFAGAIVFFLEPLKRTDQEIVTESRVAVLVDASQSMAVEDEKVGDDAGLSRSDAVLRALEDSPLIKELREPARRHGGGVRRRRPSRGPMETRQSRDRRSRGLAGNDASQADEEQSNDAADSLARAMPGATPTATNGRGFLRR